MDLEQQRSELRAKYTLNVQVTDREFECYDFEDIFDVGMDQFNNLIVTDREGYALLCLAAGSWFSFSTSREPRIESTDDTPTTDGETNGHRAVEREPDLPRDGA